MLRTDYLIKGMDAPTLTYVITGTSHFASNIKPQWYRLCEIKLAFGRLTMDFAPTDHLPPQFRSDCKHFSITVNPHRDFALYFREFLDDGAVGYILASCKMNTDGKPYFHIDMLEKTLEDGEEADDLRLTTSTESLQEHGYRLAKETDDLFLSCFSILFNYKRAC